MTISGASPAYNDLVHKLDLLPVLGTPRHYDMPVAFQFRR